MTDVDVENSVSKQHIVTLDLKEKLFELNEEIFKGYTNFLNLTLYS